MYQRCSILMFLGIYSLVCYLCWLVLDYDSFRFVTFQQQLNMTVVQKSVYDVGSAIRMKTQHPENLTVMHISDYVASSNFKILRDEPVIDPEKLVENITQVVIQASDKDAIIDDRVTSQLLENITAIRTHDNDLAIRMATTQPANMTPIQASEFESSTSTAIQVAVPTPENTTIVIQADYESGSGTRVATQNPEQKMALMIQPSDFEVQDPKNTTPMQPFGNEASPATGIIPYSIMVVTGEAHMNSRLRQVLDTWGKPRPGFHLTVVTDAPITTSLWADTLVFTETSGGRDQSQYKWALGINSLGRVSDWLLVVDDDAFVVHDNLQLLLRKLDPTRRALYGQRCSERHFCGGAGFLVHWDTLERLKPVAMRQCGPGTGVFDVCFARHMDIDFVEMAEFCSQPPAFYAQQADGSIRDKGFGAEETMKHAVTFHYITSLYHEMQLRVDAGQSLWPWQ